MTDDMGDQTSDDHVVALVPHLVPLKTTLMSEIYSIPQTN